MQKMLHYIAWTQDPTEEKVQNQQNLKNAKVQIRQKNISCDYIYIYN